MFADDLLLFANAESAACIKEVLGATFELTGLQVHCHKSNRFFSKYVVHKQPINNVLHINEAELPLKYLRLPLAAGMLNKYLCKPLIDKT